jgi:hypothetical protein
MDWVQFKDYLSEITDLDQDALHVYAAVLIQLFAALVLRRSLAHPLPWLCVLVSLLLNEAVDLGRTEGAVQQWQVLGGLRDMLNTMALPTILLLLARYAPALLTARAAAPVPGNPPEDSRP